MERKIGEIFECDGVKLRVEPDTCVCRGCYFNSGFDKWCKQYKSIRGECQKSSRSDRGVIFKKVEDMEERAIKLTLDKAKEFYSKGGEFKDLALSAFTVEELTHKELPKTWKEYKENWAEREKSIRLVDISEVELDKIKLSKDITSAHNALLALHLLRDCYRQGWKPDFSDKATKYCVKVKKDYVYIYTSMETSCFLSFQTHDIANEFIENFKDLIFKAWDLL